MPQLPSLNVVERMNQHDDFQNEAVANPKRQHNLRCDKDRQRPQPAELSRNQQPQAATQYIAHRINDRVAAITKRCSRLPITINHRVRIFENLPHSFEGDRDCQSPTRRNFSLDEETHEQQQQSSEHKAVQKMSRSEEHTSELQ